MKANYVDEAKDAIERINQLDSSQVTITKLRNLQGMSAAIQTEVKRHRDEKLPENIKDRIEYLRLRFIYEAGRTKSVKTFVKEAKILEKIEAIDGNKQEFLYFSRYMEALIAWYMYKKSEGNINGNRKNNSGSYRNGSKSYRNNDAKNRGGKNYDY